MNITIQYLFKRPAGSIYKPVADGLMRWHLHKSQSFVDAQVLSFAITDSAEIAAEAAETTSAVVLISEIAQTVRKNVIIVNRASVEHGVFEALLYISEQNQGPR